MAVLWPSERERGEAWSLAGLAGLVLQNGAFAAVIALRLALASTAGRDDGATAGLWALHDALFTLNGTFLALALLGLTLAGLRSGLVRRWHGGLGLLSAALLFTSATLTPWSPTTPARSVSSASRAGCCGSSGSSSTGSAWHVIHSRPGRPVRQASAMETHIWPLYGLRITTPRLDLRLPDLDRLSELSALAAAGVHDEDWMPFSAAWTDASPEDRGRGPSSTCSVPWRAGRPGTGR